MMKPGNMFSFAMVRVLTNHSSSFLAGALLSLIILSFIQPVFGQDFLYPAVKSNVQKISDLIPTGWTLLASAKGDLNNDRSEDIAFVLQHKDSVTFVRQKETVTTQPRILVIAFYNAKAKQYDLAEQSNSFILDHYDRVMDDPFQGISISNSVLKIDFRIWMSMGSWDMSVNYYKFRYQHNQFRLIGADYNSTNRSTGKTEDRSYNFSTKKVKIATGNISNDTYDEKWRSFPVKELKTLKTFIQPFSWEIEENFYL